MSSVGTVTVTGPVGSTTLDGALVALDVLDAVVGATSAVVPTTLDDTVVGAAGSSPPPLHPAAARAATTAATPIAVVRPGARTGPPWIVKIQGS
jgi:hypothetical protein